MSVKMASSQLLHSKIPSWIEASLFEPVFKQMTSNYANIKAFRINQPLAAGENYATIMLRIEADIELMDGSTTTRSLMLKTAYTSEMFLEMMRDYNIFEVEAGVYLDIIPELEEMYREVGEDISFGAQFYQLHTDQSHILLEDLKPRNFKNSNRLEGLDDNHTKHVLTKLAQWHAASATRVSRKGLYDRVYVQGYFRPESFLKMKEIFGNLTKYFIQSVKKYNGHEEYYGNLVKFSEVLVDELFKLATVEDNEFNVLNHGDCWSNNVMFQYDEHDNIVETFLVDFQMVKYGSPVQDLYYFLLSSTKYEIKLKQFDYFVSFYHQQLLKYLKLLRYPKKIPTLKELHVQFYKYGAWGLSTTFGVMAAVLLEPNENACMDNFMADSDVAAALKREMYTNERYRKHAESILPWLYYRGLLEAS